MLSSASAELWIKHKSRRWFEMSGNEFAGEVASRMMMTDPIYFTIYCARYKFVARLLNGTRSIAEVGCGDGFGTSFLAKSGERVVAYDIDAEMLEDCRRRLSNVQNLSFIEHDFAVKEFEVEPKSFDALVMVDVLEHIFRNEEDVFLRNVSGLLHDNGVAIIGTPNIEAQRWAAEHSRLTHVNLKSASTLRETLTKYFARVLILGQNDEVIHTGFDGMCHYLWAVCYGVQTKRWTD